MNRLRPFFIFVALLFSTSASAITDDQAGLSIDGGIGGDFSFPQIDGGLAWETTISTWFGRYDNGFALGRSWGVGLGVRQDFPRWTPRTAAVVEIRRNVDILVAGWFFFAEGGPEFVGSSVGGIANLGVGAKGRFKFSGPYVGYRVRLHAGTRIDDKVRGMMLFTLGVEWSRPFKKADSGGGH